MATAIHGGAFWNEVGSDLGKFRTVVRADVLDAWFPPAPTVLDVLNEFAVELCRTSPQADAEPLRQAISGYRGIPRESILTGGGSSSLIFGALPVFARRAQSALILDPMYGEYRHVLESNCGISIDTLPLSRADDFALRPDLLLGHPSGLVVLVNPNSPTGGYVPASELGPIVEELARDRLVWIDETYIEYAEPGASLEGLASRNANVVVCKSMSKVFALSGLRVAYLVSHPDRISELARTRPPWAVSLPAQVCASVALGEASYYREAWSSTVLQREHLARSLQSLGLTVSQGTINCVLVHLPSAGPTAAEVCERCARRSVYLRDAASMGASMGSHTLRISVRCDNENQRIVEALGEKLDLSIRLDR